VDEERRVRSLMPEVYQAFSFIPARAGRGHSHIEFSLQSILHCFLKTLPGPIWTMIERSKLKHQLPEITRKIVGTYAETPVRLHHLEVTPLPSRESIVEIINILQEILFPGYFGKKGMDSHSVQYHIGDCLETVYELLFREIYRSIRHGCQISEHSCSHCEEVAETQTMEFLRKIPEVLGTLSKDVQAAYDGDPAAKSYDEIIFSYPAIYTILIYRLAHELHVQGISLLPRIMTELAHSKTGIDIHPGAQIGPYFFIDHGTGVVIGETCEIGEHVKLYQGVTLGALSFPKDEQGNLIRGRKRHPTIENNVVIYSGATVLGGETVIGQGSVIGGNVWLTHSVPPGTKVLISEPQLIFDSLHKSHSKAAGSKRQQK
jgi:serine O-acetyltransferase